jgi:solute carrier family 25 oxoglutarate transporter 11
MPTLPLPTPPPPCPQFGVARDLIAKEGFGTLYKGLSAGLLRQATYTTARLGIFNNITIMAKEYNKGQPLPLWQKALCGLTAGGGGGGAFGG